MAGAELGEIMKIGDYKCQRVAIDALARRADYNKIVTEMQKNERFSLGQRRLIELQEKISLAVMAVKAHQRKKSYNVDKTKLKLGPLALTLSNRWKTADKSERFRLAQRLSERTDWESVIYYAAKTEVFSFSFQDALAIKEMINRALLARKMSTAPNSNPHPSAQSDPR